MALRDAARTMHVGEDIERYIVALVRATREHDDVRLGASPRSSVALYRAAQLGLLDGRAFVLPDDVRTIAHAVLDHRLLLDVDRELRGATVTGVVQAVLDQVPVPLAGDGRDLRRSPCSTGSPGRSGGGGRGGRCARPLHRGRRHGGVRLAHAPLVAVRHAAGRVHRALSVDRGGGRRRPDAGRLHLESQAAAAAWVSADDMVGEGLAIRERPQMDLDDAGSGRRGAAQRLGADVVRAGRPPLPPRRRAARDVRVRPSSGAGTRHPWPPCRRAACRSCPARWSWRRARCRCAATTGRPRPSASGVRPARCTRTRRCTGACAPSGGRLAAPRPLARHRPPRHAGQPPLRAGPRPEVVLAVDVQTLPGPHWQMTWDEPSFESLCIAAASLTRELLDGGASVGLAAASAGAAALRRLPPQASVSQLAAGRAAAGAHRAGLVRAAVRAAELVAASRHPGERDRAAHQPRPVEHLAALRRLARIGYRVELLAIGPRPTAREDRAPRRAAGLVRPVVPRWEDPNALAVAG